MDIIFDDMIQQVNGLLEHPDWLPIERCEISFYSQKLSSLSDEFQSFMITDKVYDTAINYNRSLNMLVSIAGVDAHNLTFVGSLLRLYVAGIYEASVQESRKSREDNIPNFGSQLSFDKTKFQQGDVSTGVRVEASKSKVKSLFDRLLGDVKRLLVYTGWLAVERCQISFYYEKLCSFSVKFQSFTITNKGYPFQLLTDRTLHFLVSRILDSRTVSISVDFLDLTSVGDRLASEIALIYEASMRDSGKAKESDSQDFTSQFYFDSKKFQDTEFFVGFQAETSNLLKQLASITKKKLEVIPIVGMAGLGKTTLATRLYNDPYVVSYFHLRAWVTCSQVYQKRDFLLAILKSVEITDEICMLNDNMLAHHLYRALEGQRYFIVIDDIWSSDAWNDLKLCFRDDNNGSKIMLTTRLKDVALHAQPDGNLLCLRFLEEEESLDLLRRNAFITEGPFDYLSMIEKSIIKKCRGLPLAIVVIAGLLKDNLQRDWWEKVEGSVSSYIVTDENQYMDTLALSYKHLPQHLRACFLSFGAFPEDHDIPVRTLIWLWIAEGFIYQEGNAKNLEDVAMDNLMDLIGRSLVVAGKKGSNGAIRTCRIHDLMRDLCLRKSEEENFSPNFCKSNKHIYLCPHCITKPSTKSQLFLCTDHILTTPSNCFYYSSVFCHSLFKEVSIVWDTSEIIRTLDISSIEFFVFPSELLQFVHLRYLQLRFRSGNPPESISHLRELQTLIMSSRMNMVIPNNMWKMLSLRHLCIKSGENTMNFSNAKEEVGMLENLQTMSFVSPTRPCQNILARTRNLQNLGLCGPLTTKSGDLKFPDLGLLLHLKTLKLLNTVPFWRAGRLSDSFICSESLKSLSLSNTYLNWNEAWAFVMIPNLEVLKLKFHAFVGKDWETSLTAFPRLKFLKLDELDIKIWTASRNHFPVLQRLLVYRCPCLTEIPEDFGNIYTLELIELNGCSDAATNSARDIQKEHENNGYDWLKIHLNPGLTPG